MKYIAFWFVLLIPPQMFAAPAKFLPADAGDRRSPLSLAAIDFVLPGYGTYVQDQKIFAAVYFGTNIVNLGLTYLAYRNWRFHESAYEAARIRQASEPDALLFADPTGGANFLTQQDLKNRAERGELFFTISVVANVTLRFFSATHTWLLADEARTKAGPRYEFYPDDRGGYQSRLAYSYFF